MTNIYSEVEIYDDKKISILPINYDINHLLSPELLDITVRAYRMSMKYKTNSHALHYLLSKILKLTNSKTGIVCIKKYNDDNSYYLESVCFQLDEDREWIGNWEKQVIHILEADREKATFHTSGLNGLFGRCLHIEKIVISTDYESDTRKVGLPQGHFPIKNLCSIPIEHKDSYIGVVNIGNGNYAIDKLNTIIPLLSTVSYFLNKATKPSLEVFENPNVEEMKDDFLSMISHEIRTPLTGIVGMAELIPEAGYLNEKQQEYIKRQNICIHQLMELLNDLIDFQTLKAKRLKLRVEPFSVKDCVNTSLSIIKDKASSKNLRLSVKYKTPIPERVLGDIQRLRQILINLLTNAVKFTDRGSIKIRIRATQCKTDHNMSSKWRVAISIKDTGMGIPAREQTKIFSMFKQGENSKNVQRTRGGLGLGLGLAISKSLAQLMGGEINLVSDGIPGRGSTFTVHIPFEEEISVKEILLENKTILRDTEVLAVDDKKQNRILLNEYLFKWGCKPITVESADEALQHLNRENQFKVVIIDIHMPLMSGIEMAQKIRQNKINIPLIALSSLPNKDTACNLFDHYLYKPIIEHQLLKCLLSCLTRETVFVTESPPSPKASYSPKKREDIKILIADDDASNRYSIKEMLQTIGLSSKNISCVTNGKSCVSAVSRNFYDVVFMDIKMPVMDGIEATKNIMKLDRVPTIIAISAGVSDINKERCQAIGMAGYLVKPVMKDDLIRSLSGFL